MQAEEEVWRDQTVGMNVAHSPSGYKLTRFTRRYRARFCTKEI